MPEVFNAADWLVDRHVREGDGGRTAVVTPDRTLTYEELSGEVRRAAAGLRALGVRPEERVLFCMADDVELFAGILAAFRIGAVAVPASTMLTGAELGRLVVDCRTRVVLGSAEFAPAVRAAAAEAPEVEHVLLRGEWREPQAADADDGPYPTWTDSPALWLYTSGTTGTPKAAMHRHADIRFVAETYGRQVLGIGPDDRCLSVAKLFFAYGLGNSMFFPLAVGGTALLEPARPRPVRRAGRRRPGDRPVRRARVPRGAAREPRHPRRRLHGRTTGCLGRGGAAGPDLPGGA
jgi:acyl-coenzyme A synthetase/AMP-(fatty) acid ligase